MASEELTRSSSFRVAADARQVRRPSLFTRPWRYFFSAIRETYTTQYYPLGYSPGLDGLRGVMTLVIMTAHIRYALVPGALLCMDVFYVMSGYFITGLLMRDFERYGTVRFGEFYRRRFARLLPALMAMLVGYLLFRLLFYPPFKDALIDAAIAFFYVSNWWRAFGLPGIEFMAHTWSLATEEQFYLIWPVTFLVLARWVGVGYRLVFVLILIAICIWGWRIWLTWNGATVGRLYNGLDTRADALAIGCALPIVLKHLKEQHFAMIDAFLKRAAWPLAIYGVVVVFFSIDFTNRLYFYVGIMPFAIIPGVMATVLLIRPLDTPLHRIYERPELVFLGRIFYGMYLWHFPIFVMLKEMTSLPYLGQALVGFPLTILLATLSYAFLERHFMRKRAAAPMPAAP